MKMEKKRINTKVKLSLIILMLAIATLPMPMMGSAQTHIVGPDGFLIPHYFGPYPHYATSQLPTVTYDPVTGDITGVSGGIRKFVDSLPGLGPAGVTTFASGARGGYL